MSSIKQFLPLLIHSYQKRKKVRAASRNKPFTDWKPLKCSMAIGEEDHSLHFSLKQDNMANYKPFKSKKLGLYLFL